MIEFSHLIILITLVLIKGIACLDRLEAVVGSYYESGTQLQFEKEWQKYQNSFENAIVSGLDKNFGSSAVNVFVGEKFKSHLIAKGFNLYDGVVNVYLFQMLLRELPDMVRPKLNLELPSNHLKFQSKVGRMFIDTAYYVARNKSSLLYARPEDQRGMSPFSLQQVDSFGKLVIIAEECMLSGISIATLIGESVNLGHSTIQLSDCRFTVEISTPDSGAPPVIAPYFPTGPKEKLELILGKPIVEELKMRLQGDLYSMVNTTALFGNQASQFRDNQQNLLKSYGVYIKNYVTNLTRKTMEQDKGRVPLDDYLVYMDAVSQKYRHPCRLSLTGLNLYGLDTAFVSSTGGPFNDGSPTTAADSLVFSSMQIHGYVIHDDNGTTKYDFAAELTDVTFDIVINIGGRHGVSGDAELKDINLQGWRSLEFSIIPWDTHYNERVEYESLVYGHILNVLPTRIISHLKRDSTHGDVSTQGDSDSREESKSHIKDDSNKNERDSDKNERDSDKNETDDNDIKKSSSSESNKKKEFFTDDNLDKDFFTDDNLDKDFFTDDNLDKNFFSDDKLEKDFITDEKTKLNLSSDDKTDAGNGDIEEANTHTEGIENSGEGVDKGGSDSGNLKGEGTENAGDKSVSNSSDDVESKDNGNSGTTDGDGDDSKVGIDDHEDPGEIASSDNRDEKREFFSDDNLDKSFFTDDNVKEDFMSEESVAVKDNKGSINSDGGGQTEVANEKTDEDLSDEILEDNKSSDVGNDKTEKPVDDKNENLSEDTDDKTSDSNKNNKKKIFFTDDNLDKDFFTDDNLNKDFFTDDKLEKDFFTDKNVNEDFTSDGKVDDIEKLDSSSEDADNAGSGNNDDSSAQIDSNNKNEKKKVDLDDETSESNKNNEKKKDELDDETSDSNKNNEKKDFFTDDNLDKDFFSDDNLDKDFFTDDNLDKDFFTDDKLEKEFFTDRNIKENFTSDAKVDDLKKLDKSSEDEDNSGNGNNDGSSELKDSKEDNVNQDNTSDDDAIDDNKGDDSTNSNVNGNAELKENENKLSKKKLFLDEDFFTDDNLDDDFKIDGLQRRVGKDNATASRETTGVANVTIKNTDIENLNISKENVSENMDSKVKNYVLPPNVHNARRLDNLHMSENEIY